MFNKSTKGFAFAGIVTVVWGVVAALLVGFLLASLVSAVMAIVFGLIYNLCVSPVLGWAHVGFWFVWGVFMLAWLAALWLRNYATTKASN